MNETIAKLTDHLPLDDLTLESAVSTAKAVKHSLEQHLPIDDLSLDHAVSTAKAAKHSIEQRYKPAPRKSKARFLIPLLLGAVLVAVGVKFLRDRGASQSTSAAPQSPAARANDDAKAASRS